MTTSAEPGQPSGPEPRITRMQFSSMLQRRIVDPVMVIVRAVEHDRARLEHALVPRPGQVALAEFVGDHAGLHDREVEQIAGEHEEAGALLQRRRIREDHLAVGRFAALEILGLRAAGAGQRRRRRACPPAAAPTSPPGRRPRGGSARSDICPPAAC